MDHLKNGLENYLKKKNYVRDEKKITKEEVDEFIKLYPKAAFDTSETYKKIPKFFKPVSVEHFLNDIKNFEKKAKCSQCKCKVAKRRRFVAAKATRRSASFIFTKKEQRTPQQ